MTLEVVPWRGQNVPILGGDITRSTLDEWAAWVSASARYMGPPAPITTYGNKAAEPISNSFEGFVRGMLYADGPVAAVEAYRLRVFGQAPLLYQEMVDGRAGDMFDDEVLDRLRSPWPGATLADLMKRALVFGDFAGNAFVLDLEDELVLVRPDWVEIVLEKREYRGGQVGWKQVGIVYYEGGVQASNGVAFLPGEYAHFVPNLPDPLATYRGMSWLTPLVREVQADKLANDHKVAYYENSASPNLAVSLPKEITPEQFERFVDRMDSQHQGARNSGKTLYTAGGADVTVIGANMQQQDFSAVQGKGETRVANAGGVPPTLLSFSEGMQGSSLNAGNYTAAKRNFTDTTMRDLWGNWSGSVQQMDAFKPPKPKSRLWYDGRDIPFLHEDAKDLAEIQQTQAATINSYVQAGWTPDTSVSSVAQDDVTLLEHSGLMSVQLTPPGAETADPNAEDPAADQYQAELESARSDLRWHDEITRKFDPAQRRDDRGRWALTGAVIDALKAQGGEQGHANFDGDRYWDWSSYDADDRTYNLEIGAGDSAAQLSVGDYELEQLYSALAVTRLRDSQAQGSPAVVALARLGHADSLTLEDGSYIDWSTRTDDGDYGFGVGDADGGSAEFDLSPAEMDKLIASLALSTQSEESVRSYVPELLRADYYNQRVDAGNKGGGRFRKMSDIMIGLLNDWLDGKGDQVDPLKDFQQPQLKKAAEQLGLPLKPRMSKDALKLALLKDAQARFRANRDGKDPLVGQRVRVTLQGPGHRNIDAGVYKEGDKVSLWEVSDNGQRQRRIMLAGDLASLESWADENGEPELAGWAKSEQGPVAPAEAAPAKAPVKRAPRKAPANAPDAMTPADHAANLRLAMTATEAEAYLDEHPMTASQLRVLADSIDTVDVGGSTKPALREAIINGTGGFRENSDVMLPGGFAGALASPTKAAKPAPAATDEIVSGLAGAQSRNEAHELLAGLSLADLKSVAKALSVAPQRNKGEYQDSIVEATAGTRLDARGIRQGAWREPVDIEKLARDVQMRNLRDMDVEARRDALDEQKVPELKAMLAANGLKVSGRKRDLVDRLVEHLSADTGEAPAVPATKAAPASAPAADRSPAPVQIELPAAARSYHVSLAGLEDLAATVESGQLRQVRAFTDGRDKVGIEVATDGTQVVHKVTSQGHREQMGSWVARALGLKTPRIYRNSETDVYMDYVDAPTAPDARVASGSAWAARHQAALDSDSGNLVGLLDNLMTNSDRHEDNWMLTDDNEVIPIDHGLAFNEMYQYETRPFGIGEFASRYVEYRDGDWNWADNQLTRADIVELRARLQALRPNFEHIGRLEEYEHATGVLEALAPHAVGTRNLIAAPASAAPAKKAAPRKAAPKSATPAVGPSLSALGTTIKVGDEEYLDDVDPRIGAIVRDAFNGKHGDLTAEIHPNLSKVYRATREDGLVISAEGVIKDPNGKIVGSFRRLLRPDSGTVHSDTLAIAEAYQRKGFATAFNAQADANLAQQGFTRVTVSPTAAGGVAWANYDWDHAKLAPAGDVPERVGQMLDYPRLTPSSPADVATLRAWRERFQGDPSNWPSPREIADSGDLGTKILTGASWSGVRPIGGPAPTPSRSPATLDLPALAAQVGAAEREDDVRALLGNSRLTVPQLKALAAEIGGPAANAKGTRQQIIDTIAASTAGLKNRPASSFAGDWSRATPVAPDVPFTPAAISDAERERRRQILEAPTAQPTELRPNQGIGIFSTDAATRERAGADLDAANPGSPSARGRSDLPDIDTMTEPASSRTPARTADPNAPGMAKFGAPYTRFDANGAGTHYGSAPSGRPPANPRRAAEVEGAVRKAYADARRHQRFNNPQGWVKLSDLRAELGDRYPREEVDDALQRLNRTPDVNLVPESNQKMLTGPERSAAVILGNQDKHAISISNVEPRRTEAPAPAAPQPAPRPTPPPATPAPIAPTTNGGTVVAGRYSDRPPIRNGWDSGATDSEVYYHGSGRVGQAVDAMGQDRALEVDGDSLENVIGRIATAQVNGSITGDQFITQTKVLRDRMPAGSQAQRALDSIVRDVDTPPKSITVPAGTPEPLRKLADELSHIPLARDGGRANGRDTDELDDLQQLLGEWEAGRITPLRLSGAVQSLANRRHESYEGKVNLDRLILAAAAELKAMRANPDRRGELTPPPKADGGQRSPVAVRIADVARISQGEPVNRQELGGGTEAKLLTYSDGSRLVAKDQSVRDNDGDELGALVGDALGLHTPATVRNGDQLHMEFMPGTVGAKVAAWTFEQDAILDSRDGRLMGLLDVLLVNGDRNSGNWIQRDDGGLTAIDHGFAFEGQGLTLAYGSPFARRFFRPDSGGVGADANYRLGDNDMSPSDMIELRRRLEALRVEFDRLGRGGWFEAMMSRMDMVAALARGTESRLS